MNDQISDRLKTVIPHILCGMEEAATQGKPVFAIMAQHPDGGGDMILTLNDPKMFLDDICQLLGVSTEVTEEQRTDYAATQLLTKFGLI